MEFDHPRGDGVLVVNNGTLERGWLLHLHRLALASPQSARSKHKRIILLGLFGESTIRRDSAARSYSQCRWLGLWNLDRTERRPEYSGLSTKKGESSHKRSIALALVKRALCRYLLHVRSGVCQVAEVMRHDDVRILVNGSVAQVWVVELLLPIGGGESAKEVN